MDAVNIAVCALLDISYTRLELPPSSFPKLEKHPLALEKKLIMHPFLGEMGLEIRGFLGQIEPWLRSGWIIPARRSCFYPENTVFDDPVFFQRVDEIKSCHGLREMSGRLEKIEAGHIEAGVGQGEGFFQLMIRGDIARDLEPFLAARRDLRSAFYDRYGHDTLLPTHWHSRLSSLSYPDDDLENTGRRVVLPSYLPPVFTRHIFDFPRHVGVQMRNVPQNPARNSDPERIMRLATEASAILGLPLLSYGRKEDFFLPGVQRTADLLPEGAPQLNAELAFLRSCALMIAPDSGWADLMGWLRVPTLLERIWFPGGFEALRPFSPRMALADDSNLRASIEAVSSSSEDTIMPLPDVGQKSEQDFLMPNGSMCQKFWKDFLGCGS